MSTYQERRVQHARDLYSRRKYNLAREVLIDVIVAGDVCPPQRWWNKNSALFESDKRECFRLLGSMAQEAITNLEFATRERYNRGF